MELLYTYIELCTLNVGSWILDLGSWILDLGSWILDPGSCVAVAVASILGRVGR
jgi:hypothetical protein